MSFTWKVCGMRQPDNISDVLALQPDYMGFIFYEKSSRFIGNDFKMPSIDFAHTQKVGVFVNHSIDFIFSQVRRYGLELIQLHGDETPDFCDALKSPILRGTRDIPNEVKTVKAFGVGDDFDFSLLEDYLPHCDYFLFDTKTTAYGGSGERFSWDILKAYPFETPFFLSGGIGAENLEEVLEFIQKNPQLPVFSLDINSRFEVSPALKDVGLLREFSKR